MFCSLLSLSQSLPPHLPDNTTFSRKTLPRHYSLYSSSPNLHSCPRVIGYYSPQCSFCSVNVYHIVWIFNDLFTSIPHLFNHGHLESGDRLCFSLSFIKRLNSVLMHVGLSTDKWFFELYAHRRDLTANCF